VRDACVEDCGLLDGWSCAVCAALGKLGINTLTTISWSVLLLQGADSNLEQHHCLGRVQMLSALLGDAWQGDVC
jgi:hypothetical protein